jgi:hypothetical protein
MNKYEIDNGFARVGDVYLLSGMTLKVSRGETSIEGICEFAFGKLYIYPEYGSLGVLVNIGDEVEILSEMRDEQELERRKYAIHHRQLNWRDQMGEETRSFDSSNEGW